MSSPVKFKFRVIVNNEVNYPFLVQRKWWFFWNNVEKCRGREEAEESVRKLARLELMRPGTIVFELNEQDLLAEKLKGR